MRIRFFKGNLRSQIFFPAPVSGTERDEEIRQLFQEFSMEEILDRYGFDSVVEWENTLSLGWKKFKKKYLFC